MTDINDYLEHIALQNLKTYHYKTLLLLLKSPLTQSMIGDRLGVRRQNINKITRGLEQLGYIEVDRIEGKNKFYRVVTDMKRLQAVFQGQMKL